MSGFEAGQRVQVEGHGPGSVKGPSPKAEGRIAVVLDGGTHPYTVNAKPESLTLLEENPMTTTTDIDFEQAHRETREKMHQKAKAGHPKRRATKKADVVDDNPFPVTEEELDAQLLGQTAAQTVPAQAPVSILSNSGLSFFQLDQLEAWADQPRREFDPGELAELAESIFHKGLMQNLVGRLREDGKAEIIAGGRRLRALKLLADAGRLPADFTVPVRVQALSDLEALQLATAENVERSSMTPLEEADAFARMVALGATPEDISLKFGYGLKTVQQRLVLAEGLGEDGRKLYAAGDIGLGQAQIIAQTQGPLRKHVIQSAKQGSSVQTLQHLVKKGSFLVEHAKFDAAASGLDVIEDLYGDQPARFATPKAALAKQLDWVQARAKELEGKKEQHFVEVEKRDSDYLSLPYDRYTTYDVPKSILGTLIMVSTVTGEVKEFRCARESDAKSARAKEQAAERKQAASEASGSEGGAIRKQGWIDGHEARATALRTALVGDHKRAVALTILMMLEADAVSLRASLNHVQVVAIPAGIARLKALDDKLEGKLRANSQNKAKHPLTVKFGYGPEGEQAAFEYLDALLTLTLEELLDIQSVLIAQATGGWSEYNPMHAPKPFTVRLAADTGAVVKFRLTDEHLKAYPRDRLLELATDAGLDYITANASKYPTNMALRGAVLEMADELEQRGYVPPLARFPEPDAAALAQEQIDQQYRDEAVALIGRLTDEQVKGLATDFWEVDTAERDTVEVLRTDLMAVIDDMDIAELRGWPMLRDLARALGPVTPVAAA